MIPIEIQKKIFQNAISLEKHHVNDLAWHQEYTLSLIHALINDQIGILGGDVIILNRHSVNFTGDNWHCEPSPNESASDFYRRSKNESIKYIHNYPKASQHLLFIIAFTEQPDLHLFSNDRNYNDPKIQDSAQILEDNWIMCPLCQEAWEDTTIYAMVCCPMCHHKLHNPKYKT